MKVIPVLSQNFCNAYLITEDGRNAVLVDPNRESFSVAQSNGLSIRSVLLTHGHFDHIYYCSLAQDMGAKIYATDVKTALGEGNLEGLFGIPVPEFRVEALSDGQELDLFGVKLRVMVTAGHTENGCCYLSENCIFSGDTLFCGSYGRTDFVGGDFGALKSSLRRLFSLEGDYIVYPGHGPSTTLGFEREHNPILR